MTERLESVRELEQEIAVLVRRVRRVIGERARAVHPDLQPASYLMLGHLAQHEAMRASELAELFTVDKGAISRQVQHLVDLGLVVRTPDPEDGRAHLVTATPEAIERLDTISRRRLSLLDERLGEWSAEDLAGFVATLRRYNAVLTQPLAQPSP